MAFIAASRRASKSGLFFATAIYTGSGENWATLRNVLLRPRWVMATPSSVPSSRALNNACVSA